MTSTTLVSVLTLVVGAIATLSAFGGETWRKGDEPLLDRVTKRGWVSLGCLVITVLLGIYREHLSALGAARSAQESSQAKALLQSANEKLELQRSELSRASTLQQEQSTLLLLMTLSSSPPVIASKWTSANPITSVEPSPLMRLLGPHPQLPHGVLSALRADIYLSPFEGDQDGLRLSLLSRETRETIYSDRLGKSVDPTLHHTRICTPPPPSQRRTSFECESISVSKAFDLGREYGAAKAYRGMTDDSVVATFRVSLNKQFVTQEQRAEFLSENQDLRLLSQSGVSPAYGLPHRATFAFPDDVLAELADILRQQLAKGTFVVSLAKNDVQLVVDTIVAEEIVTPEAIEFHLKAGSPVKVRLADRRN